MTKPVVLRPAQRDQWLAVLAQSFQHDFYHLPAYHALAEEAGEGLAHLFLFQEGDYFVGVPLLLRPINRVPCHAHLGESFWDATSVYGYAGPIASHRSIPGSVLRDFRDALRQELLERRVVSVFSRLHPLIPQQGVLAGLGECFPVGQTVSIDLTLPVEVQRARYRSDLKRMTNKLRRLGVACVLDKDKAYLNAFVNIYHETMRRVGAQRSYFWGLEYFEKLISALGPRIELFVCLFEDKVICAGLFTLCDHIVQAHLGGLRTAYLGLSPIKLLIDTVRLWANEQGAKTLHLGGGVGAHEDSLFFFKAGFSDQRQKFNTWNWIISPDVCSRLYQEKIEWCRQNDMNPMRSNYFPAYRCRDCPSECDCVRWFVKLLP